MMRSDRYFRRVVLLPLMFLVIPAIGCGSFQDPQDPDVFQEVLDSSETVPDLPGHDATVDSVESDNMGADPGLVPDNGTLDACDCLGETTCCDGCRPRADRRRCDAGDDAWGICAAGRCEALPGTVVEREPAGGGYPIQALSLSNDGRYAAVAMLDGTGTGGTTLWDLDQDEEVWTVQSAAFSVAIRPGNEPELAVGGQDVRILSRDDGSTLRALEDIAGPVAYDRNGGLLAAARADTISLIHGDLGTQERSLDHVPEDKSKRWTLAFSPDDAMLACATGQAGLGSPHGDVRLFDLVGDAEPRSLPCASMGAVFSPDGTRLAAACWNSVMVWDVATGEMVGQRFDTDTVLSVAWSPDGSTLATGTLGGGIKFLDAGDIRSGTPPLAVLPMPQAKAIAFDPAGRRLVAGSWMNGKVVVWTWPEPWPWLIKERDAR